MPQCISNVMNPTFCYKCGGVFKLGSPNKCETQEENMTTTMESELTPQVEKLIEWPVYYDSSLGAIRDADDNVLAVIPATRPYDSGTKYAEQIATAINEHVARDKGEDEKLQRGAEWVRLKLGLKPDAELGEVMGAMHVVCAGYSSYMRYIEERKCEEPIGEIARQHFEIQSLQTQLTTALERVERTEAVLAQAEDSAREYSTKFFAADSECERLSAALVEARGVIVNAQAMVLGWAANLHLTSSQSQMLADDRKTLEVALTQIDAALNGEK